MTMMSKAKVPPVLATTCVRHNPAIARNIEDDIKCTRHSSKYCLKNLDK